MLRWSIRSALYIDFENVPLPPEAIANWLAWLEDGKFEPGGRRRRFIQKRVYWNSHAERHRKTFERLGFTAILIGKYSGLKNGADIRMAMDIVESTYRRSEIDEFILLTSDSDFVPVLDRLREKSKRSVIVATEHRPNIHTTYRLHADLLIPSRQLTEAAHYKRRRSSLLGRLTGRSTRSVAPPLVPSGNARPSPALDVSPARAGQAQDRSSHSAATPEVASAPAPGVDKALHRVVALMRQQPQNYVAQRRVLAELDRVQGFRRRGANAFLGFGTYRALMRELARMDGRIKVVEQPGGGTGVVFIPEAPSLDMPSLDATEATRTPPAANGTVTQDRAAAPVVAMREADAAPSQVGHKTPATQGNGPAAPAPEPADAPAHSDIEPEAPQSPGVQPAPHRLVAVAAAGGRR